MLTINCDFCDKPVDTAAPGTYKRVVAWVQNRGSSTPVLPSPPVGWAHYACLDIQKKFPVNAGSEKMFG